MPMQIPMGLPMAPRGPLMSMLSNNQSNYINPAQFYGERLNRVPSLLGGNSASSSYSGNLFNHQFVIQNGPINHIFLKN